MTPPKIAKTAGGAKGGGGKKKWVRQSGNKGNPLSPQKVKRIGPSLNALGHYDGTLVLHSIHFDRKTSRLQQFFCGPVCDAIEANAAARVETGITDIMYRRGTCGEKMPQCHGSIHGWKCFVGGMPGAENWEQSELDVILKATVEFWNQIGQTSAFLYPSHVDVGSSNSPADGLRLDETLLDADVVIIIKAAYGIEVNANLTEMAEDDEFVDMYFKSVKRGRAVLLEYALKADEEKVPIV